MVVQSPPPLGLVHTPLQPPLLETEPSGVEKVDFQLVKVVLVKVAVEVLHNSSSYSRVRVAEEVDTTTRDEASLPTGGPE